MRRSELVRADRLQRLRTTHEILLEIEAEHQAALAHALKVCSLAEVAAVLGITRAGAQHHRNALRAGRTPRPPAAHQPTMREAP